MSELTDALQIYQAAGHPLTDLAELTINRLVAESTRFDLLRWKVVCQQQSRRGRADLCAADYRRAARIIRGPGPKIKSARSAALRSSLDVPTARREKRIIAPAVKPRVNSQAYLTLLEESRRAEAERAQRMAELMRREG